jgi:transcriptional regulator with XRE-family HTH domain
MTVAQVVGQNVRRRRSQLGMTAAALGVRVGSAFGKMWPRQTVYLMESGERAMVAAEVAVIAKVLEVPVSKLFEPITSDPIIAGSMVIPPETLAPASAPELDAVANSLRELEQTNAELVNLADEQSRLVRDARNAFYGISKRTRELIEEREAEAAGDWHAQMQSEIERGK